MSTQSGTLYVVSTPIGNPDDISLRAMKVLKLADTVVCEEGKMGARLLHQLRLSKPIEELNEHNEAEQTPHLAGLLREGKTLALVSDAGTPLLADPGLELVQQAVQLGAAVIAVPGASSIMTALVASGLPVHQFIFAGFLSREPAERLGQLRDLAAEPRTVVLLETPYRLLPLLEAAAKVLPERRAFLGCNLTMPSETRHYGTVAELLEKFSAEKFKGEFVFVFAGAGDGVRPPRRRSAQEGTPYRAPLRGGADRAPGRERTGRVYADRERTGRERGGREYAGRERRPGAGREFADRPDRKRRAPGHGADNWKSAGEQRRLAPRSAEETQEEREGGYKPRRPGGGFDKRLSGGVDRRPGGGGRKPGFGKKTGGFGKKPGGPGGKKRTFGAPPQRRRNDS